jgi:hypothetical protein
VKVVRATNGATDPAPLPPPDVDAAFFAAGFSAAFLVAGATFFAVAALFGAGGADFGDAEGALFAGAPFFAVAAAAFFAVADTVFFAVAGAVFFAVAGAVFFAVAGAAFFAVAGTAFFAVAGTAFFAVVDTAFLAGDLVGLAVFFTRGIAFFLGGVGRFVAVAATFAACFLFPPRDEVVDAARDPGTVLTWVPLLAGAIVPSFGPRDVAGFSGEKPRPGSG